MSKAAAQLFTAFILIAVPTFTRAQIITKTDSVNSRISYIKQKFATINDSLKHDKKTEQDIWGETTEGGGLTKYYNGKALVKMVVEFYGETGKSTEEYYYDNGKLMFYYSAVTNYDKPFYVKGYKVKSVIESRSYFSNNRIIKHIANPMVELSSEQLEKLASGILKESGKRLRFKEYN